MEGTIRSDIRHHRYLPMQMGRVGTYQVQQYSCWSPVIQDHHRCRHRLYLD